MTQPYGCTTLTVEPPDPSCPGGHFHCGVDVGMGVGTPLFAARAGFVHEINYGVFPILVGNEIDYYIHVDRAADTMRLFDPVAQGELCCYSGDKVPNGGVTTGPHLHFEVQTGDLNVVTTSVNPVPVLEGSQMNGSEKQAHVRHAFQGGLGRAPSGTELAQWASQILDDGSNVNLITSEIYGSVEGLAHQAAVAALIAAPPATTVPDHQHFGPSVSVSSSATVSNTGGVVK